MEKWIVVNMIYFHILPAYPQSTKQLLISIQNVTSLVDYSTFFINGI